MTYLKEIWTKCDQLAKKEGGLRVTKLIDFIIAHFKHGVYTAQYFDTNFHTLKNQYRKDIITYGRWCKFVDQLSDRKSIHYLQNKIDFNIKFADFIHRKWTTNKNLTLTEFEAFCKDITEIIIKPIDSWEGSGVNKYIIAESDLNNIYKTLSTGSFIIEECIKNEESLQLSKSLNTIRVTTLLDKDGQIHYIKPFLRAGVGNSVVDNYNAGGVEYEIDPETGIIFGKGFHNGKCTCTYHPQTQVLMPGFKIPRWSEVLNTVASAHKLIPECRYIGWDVAITPSAIELIEGNHDAGYFGFEYFGTTGWYKIIKTCL